MPKKRKRCKTCHFTPCRCEDLAAAAAPMLAQSTGQGWPLHSDAMGVNPSQIPAAMEADRKRGVPIDYDPKTGCAIYTSSRQFRAHAKAHGFVHRGYAG